MASAIKYLSIFSILIPVLAGLRHYKFQAQNGRLILGLCFISLLSEILSYASAVIYHNNYWVIHLYHITELIILGLFFSEFLDKRIYLYILLLLASFYLIDTIKFSGFQQINAELIGIECLILIGFCVAGYYSIFNQEIYFFLEKSPEFWFITGLTIYFSGSLFSWLLFNVINGGEGHSIGLWTFHQVANILRNICFAIGFWVANKTHE